MQANLGAAVRRYIEEHNCNQARLAQACGVDQGTISRILSRPSRRTGAGVAKVCNFMQKVGYLGKPEETLAAVDTVWDGTDDHDRALAALILASRGLRPTTDEGDAG